MSEKNSSRIPTSIPDSTKRTRPGTALVKSVAASNANINLNDTS